MKTPLLLTALLGALGLAGCGSTGGNSAGGTAGASAVPGQLSAAKPPAAVNATAPPRASSAASAREYRQDAARHVYAANSARILEGRLPPLLYAVGTLQVHLDAAGKVTQLHWMRAPKHAPEVIAQVERTVLAAAPFPTATRLGGVVWTDTWLFDDKGHFQLDTLSEGQL